MQKIAKLDDQVSVAGQLQPEDAAQIAASGYKTIINNRPDGEAPDQPGSAEIQEAAAAQGLAFADIPFAAPALTASHVRAFRQVLEKAGSPVLAYCRSGARSTLIWAAARVAQGEALDDVLAIAAQAGYDLSQARNVVLELAEEALGTRKT